MTFADVFQITACLDCKKNGASADCECVLSQTWSRFCVCGELVYGIEPNHSVSCHICNTTIQLEKDLTNIEKLDELEERIQHSGTMKKFSVEENIFYRDAHQHRNSLSGEERTFWDNQQYN